MTAGHRGEKSGRRRNQGFGDAGRDRAQTRGSGGSQARKRVHHAPHRAEQADKGRDRSRGRQPGHIFFGFADFFGGGQLHAHGDGVQAGYFAGWDSRCASGFPPRDTRRRKQVRAENRLHPFVLGREEFYWNGRFAGRARFAGSSAKTCATFEKSAPRKTAKRPTAWQARRGQPIPFARAACPVGPRKTKTQVVELSPPSESRSIAPTGNLAHAQNGVKQLRARRCLNVPSA